MMKIFSFLVLCSILFYSCADHSKKKESKKEFIDSLCFTYFDTESAPCLLTSCSYALNDSISRAMDSSMGDEALIPNFWQRDYSSPMKFEQKSDTIVVEIVHVPLRDRFLFTRIKCKLDTIYLNFSGYVLRDLPDVDNLNEGIEYPRYHKTSFSIKVQRGVSYTIVYGHDIPED